MIVEKFLESLTIKVFNSKAFGDCSNFLAYNSPVSVQSSLIDLLSLCNALGWLDLSQEITIDALNWENLPYQLASLVSISPSVKTA